MHSVPVWHTFRFATIKMGVQLELAEGPLIQCMPQRRRCDDQKRLIDIRPKLPILRPVLPRAAAVF